MFYGNMENLEEDNKNMFSIAETQKKIIECEKQTLQANQLNCHEYDVLAEEIKLLSRQTGNIKGTGHTGEKKKTQSSIIFFKKEQKVSIEKK